ncbi:hypothetical protein Tco_0371587 [Tanacetum coccineum]
MNHFEKQFVRCQQGCVDDLARAIILSAKSLAPEGKGYATKENKEGEEREVASIEEAYYQNKLHRLPTSMARASHGKWSIRRRHLQDHRCI